MNSSTRTSKVAVVIVAAGSGNRLPGDRPKAYQLLCGKPLLRYCLDVFTAHQAIGSIAITHQPDQLQYLQETIKGYDNILPTPGGETRQASVRNGLEALKDSAPDYVLIHDAARPFLTEALITRLIESLQSGHEAALPTLPVQNTIKVVANEQVENTPPRESLHIAQTPQAFNFNTILALHQQDGLGIATDDAMLAEQAGLTVHTIPGDLSNYKITYPEDLKMAEQKLQMMVPRVGMGYDVHRLIPHDDATPDRRRFIRLCGVDIPSEMKLQGHSDADAGLHALTDAILGALALGDIGKHFPPSEPRWRGANSSIFLIEANNMLHERHAKLINADITIIAEKPKLNPHRDSMRKRIAEIMNIDASRISVKATTHEKLGTLGREEGIAAQAVVSILVDDNF